jgi:histidine kinase 2/3/4 (cytokinin receptor)
VSVRVMDPHSENDESFPASESVYIVGSRDPAPRAPASIQLSQVLPNSSPQSSYNSRRDEADLARGNTAPRLSMHPGDEANTREAVAAWRAWKLTTISGRNCKPPKDFTVIVSVEDTGDTSTKVSLIL